MARLDFQLKVGDVATSVDVTEAAPLLQTDSTQVSTVMDAHAIASLPLETRNYNQLALLTPGAVTTSPGAFNTGLATFNSGRPYINGNREQANYYLLDGIDNNEFVDNNVAFSPSVDAIQEFNVITNNPERRSRPLPGRRDQRQHSSPAATSFMATCSNFCATIFSTPMSGRATSAPIRR